MEPAQDKIAFRDALRQVHGLLVPQRKRQFTFVLALMVAGALAEAAVVGSIVPFLAFLAGDAPPGPFGQFGRSIGAAPGITIAALIFIAAVLVASAIRLLLAWHSERFTLGVGHDLTVEMQRRVLLQPYDFHIQQNTSEIIASLEKVQILTFGVLQPLMQAVAAAVISLFIVMLLMALDPLSTMAAFGSIALLYLLVSSLTAPRLARNSEILGKTYGQRVKIVQESLGGIRDLIIDHSQQTYLDEFRKVDQRFIRAQAGSSFIGSAPRYAIEAAALVFIAGLAILLAGREGGLSRALPVLGALALGGLRLLPLIQQAFRSWTAVAANRVVIGQVLHLLKLPVSEEPAPDQLAPLPFKRAIELERVNFTYPGRQHPAIDRVSLTIPRGARVALVGKTGGGKSTLADLIMGLLEPGKGRITIDGTHLSGATRRAWQAGIAHVPQSIFLADASIARNIAFSVPETAIDMDRVRSSARIAQLEEFIASLPEGFDTLVGERGVRLSGGQRQRLGIARALYKQASLLVLDEATNALDRDTEAAVLANLSAERDRTLLIIAHRESTVDGCDLVLRLDKGRIVSS